MTVQLLIAALNALAIHTELAPEALALKQKLELYGRDPMAVAQIDTTLAQNLIARPAVPR